MISRVLPARSVMREEVAVVKTIVEDVSSKPSMGEEEGRGRGSGTLSVSCPTIPVYWNSYIPVVKTGIFARALVSIHFPLNFHDFQPMMRSEMITKSDGRRTDANWSSVGPLIQLPVTGVLLKVYKRMPSMSGKATIANFAHAINASRLMKKRMREITRRGMDDTKNKLLICKKKTLHTHG